MKPRLFAAVLLAPLMLGGCDGNPSGAVAPLVGDWFTFMLAVPATASNAPANVLLQESWLLDDDGTFTRTVVFIDATTLRTRGLVVEAGIWTATGDKITRIIREAAHVETTNASVMPELVPVAPRVVRARYDLQGNSLTITRSCSSDTTCLSPLPLHRAVVEAPL
jgi:hypothetical protein